MLTCQGCLARQKQYKVLQVELQFQIKKLNEDIAHQKVKLEMAHQKEAKKWAERLAFTKNQRQIENKSWMEKYDNMTQLYEDKLKKTEKQCQQTIAETHQKMQANQLITVQQNEARFHQEAAQIREESEDYKRKLLHSKEEQKKYLMKIHEEQLAKIAERHKAELSVLEDEKRQLQQTINNFDLAQQNSKMVAVEISDELIQKKLEVERLKQKVRALQHRIKFFLEIELGNRDKQIAMMRVEHEQARCKLIKQSEVEKEMLREALIKETNEKIEAMLQKEYVKCTEYEKKLKYLDEQRQREISLYQKQLDTMRCTAEERFIPKSLFHEEISTLKGRLTSKEKDIERAKEQIKQCKLEIENNEEILTKFFKTNTHTHTAPDIFVNTPKKKDYKIKKNRVSVSGAGFLDPGKFSNITSMECLQKTSKDFESYRIL